VRSCLILGSARSGTSMLAGSLKVAGYYMGEHLWEPRDSNPLGFFEDEEINAINELLIAGVTKPRPRGILARAHRGRPTFGQRWLSRVPVGTPIPCPVELRARIQTQAMRAPFSFKDPRFCYTLPVWRPFVGDAAFLCIFREPSRTAQSILKECRDVPYLHDLSMSFTRAVQVWILMYRHVLETHRHAGDWLFLHYDQVLNGSASSRIRALLGVEPDPLVPKPVLKRSPARGRVGQAAQDVYRQLCGLAYFNAERESQ
jgi:hypothetical protein